MFYRVTEMTNPFIRRSVVRSGFATAEAALAWIDETMGIVDAEADADHSGFWGVFTSRQGRLVAIEPVEG